MFQATTQSAASFVQNEIASCHFEPFGDLRLITVYNKKEINLVYE